MPGALETSTHNILQRTICYHFCGCYHWDSNEGTEGQVAQGRTAQCAARNEARTPGAALSLSTVPNSNSADFQGGLGMLRTDLHYKSFIVCLKFKVTSASGSFTH